MKMALPIVDESGRHTRAMQLLKACFWRGSLRPMTGHVEAPVPIELTSFQKNKSDWFKGIYQSDGEAVRNGVAHASKGLECKPLEYRMMAENGVIVWVRHWFFPTGKRGRLASGNLCGFVQVLDERKRLEEECLRVCEREKAAIGQELHDDVCQLLAGVACVVEVISQKAKAAMPEMMPTLRDLSVQLNGGMDRTRSLAHGLVPMRLVSKGLAGALRELAAQASRNFSIKVHVSAPRHIPPQKPEHILHLYRIMQEAIGNAFKHGKATEVDVNLRRDRKNMTLTIHDNGSGIPAESRRKEGIGLHVMRYRAAAIDGQVQIVSRPKKGTKLTVTYGSNPVSGRSLGGNS